MVCQTKAPKRFFLKVVTRSNGGVGLGNDRSFGSRGAYVCFNEGCIHEAVRKGRLTRTLRKEINTESLERLKEAMICRLR